MCHCCIAASWSQAASLLHLFGFLTASLYWPFSPSVISFVQPAGPSLSQFFPRDELLVYSRKMRGFNQLVPKCMALHFVLLNFIQFLLQQSSRFSSSFCTLCQTFSVLVVPPYFFPLSHSYFCARVINENIKEEASCWELQ